jgi:2-polyprenyl-3-methyl-5-hydroxy-6-metoxy-1,4-benzoquinol methylase
MIERAMAEAGPRRAMEVFIRANAGDAAYESWLASADPALRERIFGNAATFFSVELPMFATFVPDRDRLRASGVPLTVLVGEENRDTWYGAAARWLVEGTNARLVEMPGGHAGFETHRAELVALVRRIGSGASGAGSMTHKRHELDVGEAARRDALVERLFGTAIGTFELATLYLGDRLGLYRTLAETGAATPIELARRTGTAERYVREWLEQQAVAGVLDLDDAGAWASDRRYTLPAGHAEALLDRDSLAYLAPLARQVVGVLAPLPAVLKAFRGGGVPFTAYGADLREGIAEANRVLFLNQLGTTWIPAMPDVHARLRADPPARVADVACGSGWSSIAIARAYPNVRVDGFDLDEASISLARENATREGLADRVSFSVQDAAEPRITGQYDLVTAFECVHDLADPVAAFRSMRGLLAANGAVLIGDERVAERFVAPGDDLERLNYGFSVLHCLPASMVDQPSAGTGTAMRPATLREYAVAAGFQDVEILPIEHDLWRFYRPIT